MSDRESRKRQVRCLNCFQRFSPSKGVERTSCPHCGTQWRLTWSSEDSVKIRGPVWSALRGQGK